MTFPCPHCEEPYSFKSGYEHEISTGYYVLTLPLQLPAEVKCKACKRDFAVRAEVLVQKSPAEPPNIFFQR